MGRLVETELVEYGGDEDRRESGLVRLVDHEPEDFVAGAEVPDRVDVVTRAVRYALLERVVQFQSHHDELQIALLLHPLGLLLRLVEASWLFGVVIVVITAIEAALPGAVHSFFLAKKVPVFGSTRNLYRRF